MKWKIFLQEGNIFYSISSFFLNINSGLYNVLSNESKPQAYQPMTTKLKFDTQADMLNILKMIRHVVSYSSYALHSLDTEAVQYIQHFFLLHQIHVGNKNAGVFFSALISFGSLSLTSMWDIFSSPCLTLGHSFYSTWPGEFLCLMLKKCQHRCGHFLLFLLSIGVDYSCVTISTSEFLIEMSSILW